MERCHISEQKLKDYVYKVLNENEYESIAKHIRNCPVCQRHVRYIKDYREVFWLYHSGKIRFPKSLDGEINLSKYLNIYLENIYNVFSSEQIVEETMYERIPVSDSDYGFWLELVATPTHVHFYLEFEKGTFTFKLLTRNGETPFTWNGETDTYSLLVSYDELIIDKNKIFQIDIHWKRIDTNQDIFRYFSLDSFEQESFREGKYSLQIDDKVKTTIQVEKSSDNITLSVPQDLDEIERIEILRDHNKIQETSEKSIIFPRELIGPRHEETCSWLNHNKTLQVNFHPFADYVYDNDSSSSRSGSAQKNSIKQVEGYETKIFQSQSGEEVRLSLTKKVAMDDSMLILIFTVYIDNQESGEYDCEPILWNGKTIGLINGAQIQKPVTSDFVKFWTDKYFESATISIDETKFVYNFSGDTK